MTSVRTILDLIVTMEQYSVREKAMEDNECRCGMKLDTWIQDSTAKVRQCQIEYLLKDLAKLRNK